MNSISPTQLAVDSAARTPERLAAPARADDPAARVRRIVDEHYDFVWRALRRLGVPEASAEDAAQQVFCVLSQRIGDIPSEKEKSFLFGTAMRIAKTARRSLARRKELSDDTAMLAAAGSEHDRPDSLLEERRDRETLDELLAAMPPDLLAVFVLHEIEQVTMAESATILELAPGTVASRLRRAREWFSTACAAARANAEMGHE